MNRERAFRAVARCHQSKFSVAFILRERFLLILRPYAALLRKNPDLQQMDWIAARRIDLAVQDARSGAHALYFAGADDRSSPHVVAMFQLTLEDVSDDFH